MKKAFIIFLIISMTITTIVIFHTPKKKTLIRIGILQTASHPALDAARDGFIKELSSSLPGQVEYVVKNAQGSINNAQIIAQNFHHDMTIDAILAIATPAALAAASVEKEKPVVITAVTDPASLGLIPQQKNICGSSDMINVQETIRALKELCPEAESVAILFNTGEKNSLFIVEKLEDEIRLQGLKPLRCGVTSQEEIPAATAHACMNADVVLAPTDNTVATTLPFIAKKALESGKPLIACDIMLVKHGAALGIGISYETVGKAAAECAHQVLSGKKQPHEMPLAFAQGSSIYANSRVMQQLKLQAPKNCINIE